MRYLNLAQTLKKLQSIPASYQPQEIPQLSDACMKKKIIPVFIFNGYSLAYVCGTGDHAEYINIPVRGYLTHESISNIFNWYSKKEKKVEITEAVIHELTQQEELISKGDRIVLAKKTFHHLVPLGNIKSEHFDVKLTKSTKLYSSSDEKDAERIRQLGGVEISQNDLLFPIEQVQDYIDSFIYNDENHINSLVFDSSETDAKISSQAQEIAELRSLLDEVNADNKNIKAQISKYDNTSTELKDSAYCLIAVMKDLLLDPDVQARHFKGSNNKPSQTGLAEYITSLKIKDLKTRNIDGIFSNANKLLNEAKKY